MREFQTLPGRSHPMMSCPTSGGYILLGIRVKYEPTVGTGISGDEQVQRDDSQPSLTGKKRARTTRSAAALT